MQKKRTKFYISRYVFLFFVAIFTLLCKNGYLQKLNNKLLYNF